MKKAITICVLLWSVSAWAMDSVGEVVDFSGEATVLHAGQFPVKPSLQQPIFVGDILETKKNGAIKILFKDDTILTLKENSKTVINEYLFEAKTKKRRAVFNILFGKIRTVVGRFFGKDELVELKTPTAIAGIRGTDVGADVTSKRTIFYCFSGSFNAFNITSPENIMRVPAGTFTEIFERADPTPPVLTPENIETQKDILFDIPLGQPTSQAAETKVVVAETTSAGTQVVQTARQEVVTQSSSATVLATQVMPPTETALQTVANASQTEEFTTSTNPTTTTSSGTEIIPGGSAAATNPITITITLPKP